MKRTSLLIILLSVFGLFISCQQPSVQTTKSGLRPTDFDIIISLKPVRLYTLTNQQGMEVCITNYGGRIVSIMAPNRQGNMQDVVLGYDNIRQYADIEGSPSDFGAAIGRYANRIRQGRITAGDSIKVYSGNFLGTSSVAGKHGIVYPKQAAVCLETQHYPDSPNHPEWPSPWLKPSDTYKSHCVYRFSVVK